MAAVSYPGVSAADLTEQRVQRVEVEEVEAEVVVQGRDAEVVRCVLSK